MPATPASPFYGTDSMGTDRAWWTLEISTRIQVQRHCLYIRAGHW